MVQEQQILQLYRQLYQVNLGMTSTILLPHYTFYNGTFVVNVYV